MANSADDIMLEQAMYVADDSCERAREHGVDLPLILYITSLAFAYPLHLNDRLTPIGGLIYNDVRRRIVIIHDEVHL